MLTEREPRGVSANSWSGVNWDLWLAALVRVGLLACCLLPMVVSPGTIYPFTTGKSVFFRIAVDLIVPLYVLLAMRCPEYRPRPGVVLLAFLGFVGAVLLATLFGLNPERSLWSTYARSQGVVEFLHFSVWIVMAASMFRSWAWRWSLLWTNVVVNAAILTFGMLCYYFWPHLPFVDGDVRLHSTLGQPTFFSAYCTFSILVALMAWTGLRRWRGLHWHALLATGLFVLILSNVWGVWLAAGRMSVLSLVLVSIFCGVTMALFSRTRTVRLAGAVGVGAAVLVVVGVGAVMLTDRLTVDEDEHENLLNRFSRSLTERDNSAKGRYMAILNGLKAYRDRPVLGWGPELFDYGWVKHITAEQHNGRIFDQSHNKIIEVAATTGTVGLLSYLALIAAMCLVFFRMLLRERERNLPRAVFMSALLLNYMVVSMFLFDTTSFLMSFAVLTALAALVEHDHPVGLARWSEAWSRLRGRMRMPDTLRHPLVPALLLPAVLVAITVCAVVGVLFTARIHQAALHKPVAGKPLTTVANYGRTVEAFPAMAQQQRIDFTLNMMPYIPHMSHDQKQASLPFMVKQLEVGMNEDDDYWRLHYVAVVFYAWIKDEREDFRERAQLHLSSLRRLSPNSFYIEDAERIMREYLR